MRTRLLKVAVLVLVLLTVAIAMGVTRTTDLAAREHHHHATPTPTAKTTPPISPSSPVYSPLVCPGSPPPAPFVTNANGALVQGVVPLNLRGFTFYPADDGGSAAWVTSAFSTYLDTHVLAQAAALGQNLLRPTDQFDSHTANNWDNSVMWTNMDHLVCGARAHGDYVLLDLSFMAKVLTAQGKTVLDATNWYPLLDAVAVHYAAQPNIVSVSFLGEPQYPSTQAQLSALLTFYRALLTRWWAHDPNHLLSAGGLTHLMYGVQGWWKQVFALPHNSLVSFKTYSLHDEQYQPTVNTWAQAQGQVLVDEEFGLPQSMGDATWSGQTYNGLQVSRASFYTWVYTHAQSGAWGMTIFWNSACLLGGTHYDVSAATPAVWAVVTQYAAVTPSGTPVC